MDVGMQPGINTGGCASPVNSALWATLRLSGLRPSTDTSRTYANTGCSALAFRRRVLPCRRDDYLLPFLQGLEVSRGLVVGSGCSQIGRCASLHIRREACIQDANLRKTVLISDHQ
jgi:hypothetical protein